VVGYSACQEVEEREGHRETDKGGDERAGGDLNIEEEREGNKKNKNKKVSTQLLFQQNALVFIKSTRYYNLYFLSLYS
jgi:hypothetical protein